MSGLLQGDVVVEVNGQNVEKESLEDVILHVKKGGDTLSLLVVDQKGYDWLKKNGKPITVNKLAPTSEVFNNTVYLTALSVIKPHTPKVFKIHKQRHNLSHAFIYISSWICYRWRKMFQVLLNHQHWRLMTCLMTALLLMTALMTALSPSSYSVNDH